MPSQKNLYQPLLGQHRHFLLLVDYLGVVLIAKRKNNQKNMVKQRN